MSTLSIIISSTSGNGATRLVLLSLVLVAVVLLLAGSTIAILTFINQRKASQASIPSNQLQGENT